MTDDKWFEIVFEIYGIPVIADAQCPINQWRMETQPIGEMAKHIRALDDFLKGHNLKLASISVC